MKRKIKKIFLELISNTKILFNNFFKDQDFAKLKGGLDNVEYGNLIKIKINLNEETYKFQYNI